ncbi:MAG TPA: nucleotidyl transferase AbiEii/AbiGii toxin family protein [Cellvibrionaceae bacterium]|nr:nucleotidyl transferase AbiEii/AbiGii toxin family protein [Cellvibrionaceae bacterium]HMW49193.1 nucleotidyl transferase AbiEii/AbiGii toxin family protein [Cellvibrionaceae bacterium]HMW70646.1 nucleotidyl transferase AbiEii/AbiGii toxin family protein [Cellvibrionaceae bacterium]HMY38041.1 nucleotidyl transferase AbiEii/AbiGii toxin family protein [Marinagarivorans sp.]HNG59309.1 nucleotidyl transferase AbiEii/AbiGii toxin family protein [Cellvibrionaceae bacterium]
MSSIGIEQIKAVAGYLGDLCAHVVFVGGATTALLVDSVASDGARQTEDIDFVIDISLPGDFQLFERKMRERGFEHDQSQGAPICRWIIPHLGTRLIVDAMPMDEKILGFSNRWYHQVIATAWQLPLDSQFIINVVDSVYFLGTKFEAWLGRGKNDIYAHDLEDIFYVLEHRTGIEQDIFAAESAIQKYLAVQAAALLSHPGLDNNLPGLVDSVSLVKARLKFIARLGSN